MKVKWLSGVFGESRSFQIRCSTGSDALSSELLILRRPVQERQRFLNSFYYCACKGQSPCHQTVLPGSRGPFSTSVCGICQFLRAYFSPRACKCYEYQKSIRAVVFCGSWPSLKLAQIKRQTDAHTDYGVGWRREKRVSIPPMIKTKIFFSFLSIK